MPVHQPQTNGNRSNQHKPLFPKLTYKDIILALVFAYFCLGATQLAYSQQIPTDLNESAMVLRLADGTEQVVGMTDTQVNISIRGLVAEIELQQSFINLSDHWADAVYAFPMPDQAAMHGMELIIGDRRIVGEIQEKQQAARTYTAAKAAGKQASLVSQARPDLFTTKVANIAPQEMLEVKLKLAQRVTYRDGQFSLHFPLARPARYLNTDDAVTLNAMHTASTSTGQPVTISANLVPGFRIARLESSSHGVLIDQFKAAGGDPEYRISLAEGLQAADKDFELVWEPVWQEQPEQLVFTEQFDGETYALMMLMPPEQRPGQRLPREIVFVIDTSGSMHGPALEQAKASLIMGLASLQPEERFNVIEFDSTTRSIFDEPVTASSANIGAAIDFIEQMDSDGGTNMAPALTQALAGHAPEGFIRQIVFATDGAVGNEAQLLKYITDNLAEHRLFTVAIGQSPNAYFMRRAANLGRGTFTRVSDISQVDEKVDRLLRQLENPVLSDLDIIWPSYAEAEPSILPDLYSGDPLVVFAKLDHIQGNVQVAGNSAADAWFAESSLHAGEPGFGISTLWAKQRIAGLTDAMAMGADRSEVVPLITELALKHQLTSAYTSFVAVDKTPANVTAERNRRLALDASAMPLALPQTATSALRDILLGLAFCLIGLIFVIRLKTDR